MADDSNARKSRSPLGCRDRPRPCREKPRRSRSARGIDCDGASYVERAWKGCIGIFAGSTLAVPIRCSVQPEYVVCLECGFRGLMLRRHLGVAHGLDPAAYRSRWKLPVDHPITAPVYAEQRSTMAKKIGLGRRRAAVTVPPAAARGEDARDRRRRAGQDRFRRRADGVCFCRPALHPGYNERLWRLRGRWKIGRLRVSRRRRNRTGQVAATILRPLLTRFRRVARAA